MLKMRNLCVQVCSFESANLRVTDMLTVTEAAVHTSRDHAPPAVDCMFWLAKLLLPWSGL